MACGEGLPGFGKSQSLAVVGGGAEPGGIIGRDLPKHHTFRGDAVEHAVANQGAVPHTVEVRR